MVQIRLDGWNPRAPFFQPHGGFTGGTETCCLLRIHAGLAEILKTLREYLGTADALHHEFRAAAMGLCLDAGNTLLGRGFLRIKHYVSAKRLGNVQLVIRNIRSDDFSGAQHARHGDLVSLNDGERNRKLIGRALVLNGFAAVGVLVRAAYADSEYFAQRPFRGSAGQIPVPQCDRC